MGGCILYKVLLIDMEYVRDEINEPLNIDTLIHCLSKEIRNSVELTVFYRKLNTDNIELIGLLQKADLILISTKISSWTQLEEIINLAGNKIIILGGVLATYACEKIVFQYKQVICAIGEGETNIDSLIAICKEKRTLDRIKKEIYLRNVVNICMWYDGNIMTSKRLGHNLSKEIQYPIHNCVRDIIKFDGIVRMELSRGCPWNKCNFCVMEWRYAGKRWRRFPLVKISEEIQFLSALGVNRIYFTDEDFVANYNNIIEFCNLVYELKKSKKINENMIWGGSTSVYTLELLGERLIECLDYMYQVGIRLLFIGIESGSDTQLRRYNKGVSAIQNKKILKILNNYDFDIDVGFIMFDAETTIEELEQNIAFLKECNLDENISRFTKKLRICPHTFFYEDYKRKGYLKGNFDLNELDQDYIFVDKRIDNIYSYILKLNDILLEKSNSLQSKIRMSLDIGTKRTLSRELIDLRKKELEFLELCVRQYKADKNTVDFYDSYFAITEKLEGNENE